MSLKFFLQLFQKPVRFDLLDRYLKQPGIKVLDVGCGNHSPSKTKSFYPEVEYYGIDISKQSLDENDFIVMHSFYNINLDTEKNLDRLIGEKFDVIVSSHLIEHLEHPDLVIEQLVKLLKPGGIIYLETPHPRSVNFPSMAGTLNFYDDLTHRKVYPVEELKPLLTKMGCKVLEDSTRRSLKRIVLMPIYLGYVLVKKLEPATVFWDVLGFAHYTIASKIDS
jgi:2-polyprenyl-3-methyl-5-hydroxy-6-metoxy-1,4-benzoquinol methylase